MSTQTVVSRFVLTIVFLKESLLDTRPCLITHGAATVQLCGNELPLPRRIVLVIAHTRKAEGSTALKVQTFLGVLLSVQPPSMKSNSSYAIHPRSKDIHCLRMEDPGSSKLDVFLAKLRRCVVFIKWFSRQ